jgi:hypothetical protein
MSVVVEQIHEWRVSCRVRKDSPVRRFETFSTADRMWESQGGAETVARDTAQDWADAGYLGIRLEIREVSAWRGERLALALGEATAESREKS